MGDLAVKYIRSYWPRRCYLSGKPLFLKKCYKITCKIHGPGTTVYLHAWVTKRQYLMLELQGKLDNEPYDFWIE